MNKLNVRLQIGPHDAKEVGQLVLDARTIYFRYASAYLQSGHNLSPFKLSFDDAIQRVDTAVFDGLYGVFADSLPDGWGQMLTDRWLAARGVALSEVSVLQRLAIVGASGPGALTYHPAEPITGDEVTLTDLDALAAESALVLSGGPVDIDRLAAVGGSSGGARPKILVGYDPGAGALVPDATVLPKGYQSWIIKFRSGGDRVDAAAVEYAYALMAAAAGLEMAPCRLFVGASGARYFGTQRFDRAPAGRLHMGSAAGLLHDNFRLPALDYGHLMDATRVLTKRRPAALEVLRLAAFNVFANNRDDHSKNFAFLMDAAGQWRFSPAYDLTYAPSAHGEHSLTVAGEGRAPGESQLLELASAFELKGARSVITTVREAVREWPAFAAEASVGQESLEEIGRALRV